VKTTDAHPLTPPLVAVIGGGQPARAVTVPVELTVATVVLFEVHATTRPVRTLFATSRSTAVAAVV
jgi:hypothetical protein